MFYRRRERCESRKDDGSVHRTLSKPDRRFATHSSLRNTLSVPGTCRPYRLTRSIMFGKQLNRLWSAFDARRKGRSMFAGDHEGIAAGKLVRVDVATTSDTMDVLRFGRPGAGLGGDLGFSFSLGESLFSFHRSLRHGRVTRRVGAVIRGSDEVSKGVCRWSMNCVGSFFFQRGMSVFHFPQ